MLTFRGNAINRTLTNTISKFYANLYNTTSPLENIDVIVTLHLFINLQEVLKNWTNVK